MDYAICFFETTGIEIQIEHSDGTRKFLVEDIAIEYFPNLVKRGNNETNSEFHLYKSDDNEQDSSDSLYHMFHLYINKLIRVFSVWHVNSMRRH